MEQSEVVNDTICAISTPAGVGGIALCRISGPRAFEITEKIWRGISPSRWESHTAHLGDIVDPADLSVLDSAVAVAYRAPRSFTAENVVEISVHGSKWIQRELVNLLIRQGCRLALPGEFTRRAFAAGRLDLAEAEAVADVIASTSRAAHRLAIGQMKGHFSQKLRTLRSQLVDLAALLELELDFSEEDVEFASRLRLYEIATEIQSTLQQLTASFAAGQAIKDGVPVAIIGATNAGKSTLLNLLVGEDRAIVSDIHGTTRDSIEDTAEIGHALFRFVDTAGLRQTTDAIERIGISRSLSAAARARIVLWLVDPLSPRPLDESAQMFLSSLAPDQALIVALNKTDAATPRQLAATRDALIPLLASIGRTPAQSNSTPTHDASRHPADAIAPAQVLEISALSAVGLDSLKSALLAASGADAAMQGEILLTNARHYQAFLAASASNARVVAALSPAPPTTLASPSSSICPDSPNATFSDPNPAFPDSNPAFPDSLASPSSNPAFPDSLASPSSSIGPDPNRAFPDPNRAFPVNPLQAFNTDNIDVPLTPDLIAQDVRETIHHLSSITGDIPSSELLSTIFSRFCIGK